MVEVEVQQEQTEEVEVEDYKSPNEQSALVEALEARGVCECATAGHPGAGGGSGTAANRSVQTTNQGK